MGPLGTEVHCIILFDLAWAWNSEPQEGPRVNISLVITFISNHVIKVSGFSQSNRVNNLNMELNKTKIQMTFSQQQSFLTLPTLCF